MTYAVQTALLVWGLLAHSGLRTLARRSLRCLPLLAVSLMTYAILRLWRRWRRRFPMKLTVDLPMSNGVSQLCSTGCSLSYQLQSKAPVPPAPGFSLWVVCIASPATSSLPIARKGLAWGSGTASLDGKATGAPESSLGACHGYRRGRLPPTPPNGLPAASVGLLWHRCAR